MPYNPIASKEGLTANSPISSSLRRCGLFCAAAALTLYSWCAWSKPVAADTEHDRIANSIIALQGSSDRWIQIDLGEQKLIAWEGGNPIYAIVVSTGKESTPTPTGRFAIQSKHELARMQGPGYDVPNVPFTMYYHRGYGIHGANWHNNFGTPVSHGCTNVAVNHAKWLFEWASVGTPVVVHD
ncbi:MAG: L,D-transpeptidase [Oscillatoria sp. SIO1A7]|nr:L,D-transpeptidase [Oscillatoria sp. SIO1A7]